MDRLKQVYIKYQSHMTTYLHSNMDRLKLSSLQKTDRLKTDLHSNMDRLKRGCYIADVVVGDEFTFQYG